MTNLIRYRNTNIYVHGTRHRDPDTLPWDAPTNVSGVWVFRKPGAVGMTGIPAQYDFGSSSVGDFDSQRADRIVGHLDNVAATRTGHALFRELASHVPHVVEITSKLDDSTCSSPYTRKLAHSRRRLAPMSEYPGPSITSQDVGIVYDPYEEVDPWCRTLVPGPPELAGDGTLVHEFMHAVEFMSGRTNETAVPSRLQDLEGWYVPTFTDLGEFHAVLVENIYLSEKSPNGPLRWGHPGIRPLVGPLRDPRRYLAVFCDEITKLHEYYPRLFEDLRALCHISWNPIAHWNPE